MVRRFLTMVPLVAPLVGAVLTGLLWGVGLEEPTRLFFLFAAVTAFVIAVLIASLSSRARMPSVISVGALAMVLLIANFIAILSWIGHSE